MRKEARETAAETVRIEIPIETIDNTDPGISSATKKIEKMEKAAESANRAAKKASNSISQFDRRAEKTERSLAKWAKEKYEVLLEAKDRISPILHTLGTNLRGLAGRSWNISMRAMDLASRPIRGIINLLKNPVFQVGAVLGVSIGMKDTIDTYKNFEAAMSQVQAISGATGSDFDKLTAKAKEMGATTKFTAEESAQAFNYMAMAGWKTNDMLDGIEGILNLAAASNEDLATTSDIVTDSLTAFNMQASDAGHFSDVMAAAASNANTNVSMMGETFKYAGAMAGTLGYSIEDVALMTGLMANSGIKATMSGTALNMMFTRLSTNSGNARDQLEDLGVKFFDDAGNARDLSDVMGELRKATAGMNDEQKSAIANTIAGTQAQKGLLAILNASEKDYNDLANAVENADGAAERMADTMLDNLSGSLTLLNSAVDNAKLSLGERLSPYVRGLAGWLTDQMPDVQEELNELMDMVDKKAEDIKDRYGEITQTKEWQNADIFGKSKILWDEFIYEPFSEWWNNTGKAKFSEFSEDVGKSIGTGLKIGIMALLGIDIDETVDEGASLGRSFAKGFSEGFDGSDISGKLLDGIGNLFSSAGRLLPGGQSAGISSLISAYLLNKIISPAISLGRGGMSIGRTLFGAGADGGTSLAGTLLGSAAKGTGLLGNSAMLAMNLGAGNLAGGASLSAGALSALGLGASAGAVAGGATLISGAMDTYKAIKSDNRDEKSSYGESAAWKFGGVAAGAAAGAALGSVIPGLGTAVGALIGAGVGGVAGWIKGNKVKEEYQENLEKMQLEAAKAQKIFQATGMDIDNVRFKNEALTEAMNDSEVSAEKFASMFQEEVTKVMQNSFGKIHLSMQEVRDLASDITFGNMKESLNEFTKATEDVTDSLSTLEKTSSNLKKQNWKAGLGIGLTEQDQDNYKTAVDNYVEAVKEYIDNSHYEATVALSLLTNGEGNREGLDSLYQGYKENVVELGTKMQEEIEKSLSDGIMDVDEMRIVEEYQTKINNITNKLTEAQNEAKLQTIGIKYSGSELDAESFQAMQEELKNYSDLAQQNYDDALTVTLTNLNLELADGAISKEEYEEAVKQATEGYQAQIDSVSARINDFNLEAIANAYGDKLDSILPQIEGTTQEKLQQALNDAMLVNPNVEGWTPSDIISWFGLDKAIGDTETQTAIAAQLKQSALANADATKQQLLDSYKSSVPTADEIYNAIDWSSMTFDMQGEMMKMLNPSASDGATMSTGDNGAKLLVDEYGKQFESAARSMSQNIHDILEANADPNVLSDFMKTYMSEGISQASIPDEAFSQVGSNVGNGVGSSIANADMGPINAGITSLYGNTKTSFDSAFSAGFRTTLPVTLDYQLTNGQKTFSITNTKASGSNTITVTAHAGGGYVDKPQLSTLAEEGWGEYIIPTNPSRRSTALELYREAGNALGVNGSNLTENETGNYFSMDSVKNVPLAYNESTDDNYNVATPNESGVSSLPPVEVNVNVSPEFVIQGGEGQSEDDIVAVIRRHLKEIADELGGEIAMSLEDVFSNMPLKEA